MTALEFNKVVSHAHTKAFAAILSKGYYRLLASSTIE